MSRPTATRAIRTLQAAGLIAVQPRRTPNGDPTSHEYTLLPVPDGSRDSQTGVV